MTIEALRAHHTNFARFFDSLIELWGRVRVVTSHPHDLYRYWRDARGRKPGRRFEKHLALEPWLDWFDVGGESG